MHWADVIADEIIGKCDRPLISTGISPTGFIHVGSLREAITAEAVRSAIESKGSDVKMIYLIDSIDPLRKRYGFLDESFENHVGKPICRIPCPCGKHDTYADHFIQPFLEAKDGLGVKCEIIWTHELYEQGKFADAIDAAIVRREKVIEILTEVSQKEKNENYAPYNPLCPKCGRFVKQADFDSYVRPYLRYRCEKCGHEGTADITKGDGKLTWRLEWPAKWKIFSVSAEPFGKDHAAAGGSYDTGVRIVREIFDGEPPRPIPYEFVQLKGKGQMHKSTGSSVTGIDAISMTPPEVLTYTFLRVNPERHIDYDSEMGILDMADEYDRMETFFFEGGAAESDENALRAYELSKHNNIPKKMPLHIPYRHLVNVVQMADDIGGVLEILKRNGDFDNATDDDLARLKQRVVCVRFWLNGFAPEAVKFSVSKTMPDVKLSDDESSYLRSLVPLLSASEWNAEKIHNIVSDAGKNSKIGTKGGFQALYKVLIDRTSGPRLGHFLATMEKDFVIRRLSL
ncbi:MAG: lysine--tRNA ligase [Methanomassiliicoccaceae archaeon]|jgi:lysyl-tRNA synthetase class 1|nr:lysine--tRNA ligase [Methanomassiliicoccaceae archaeon]